MKTKIMSRLKDKYKNQVVPKLAKEWGLKNPLAVPKPEKVVVNMGVGSRRDEARFLESASRDLAMITGQQPAKRVAKRAVAGFKLKAGEEIGLIVTLRGDKMWDFLDKLFRVVLPRLRDFRGLLRSSFDGKGNYSLGIREHTVFPEIDPNKVDRIKSLGVTITTTTTNDQKAEKLLEELGMPFKKN